MVLVFEGVPIVICACFYAIVFNAELRYISVNFNRLNQTAILISDQNVIDLQINTDTKLAICSVNNIRFYEYSELGICRIRKFAGLGTCKFITVAKLHQSIAKQPYTILLKLKKRIIDTIIS